MADLYNRRGSLLDYLPGNVQQSINTSPFLNALGRALNRPSPDLTRGIEHDQHGNVSDRNWLMEMARGGPPKLNPLASEMLEKGSTLAMFLGPAAKTADLKALARAHLKTASGVPREQVWKEDGWFQGPDGKWRFEISDLPTWAIDRQQAASLPRAEGSVNPRLGDAFKHDEYFKAYPEARDMIASFHYDNPPLGTSAGSYYRPSIRQDGTPTPGAVQAFSGPEGQPGLQQPARIRSIALHELQHDAQFREGFAKGGSPRDFTPAEVGAERARMAAVLEDPKGWTSVGAYSGDMPDAEIARELYRRLAGEVEARTVQTRWNMTPEQRRERPPWLDYDVPEDRQIVRQK